MRGITLRESGLFVHSLFPPSPKPPNYSFTSHLLSLSVNYLPNKHSSKLSSRNQSLFFSRCYRNWCASTCEEWFEVLFQKVAGRQHGLRVDCKNKEEIMALVPKSEDSCVSDHAPVNNNLKRGNYVATNLAVSNSLFNNLLKFMFLSVVHISRLTTSSCALDFASGLQSIPYVGDLGDISTGILADIFLRNRRQPFSLRAMTIMSVFSEELFTTLMKSFHSGLVILICLLTILLQFAFCYILEFQHCLMLLQVIIKKQKMNKRRSNYHFFI
ncbi:hypothetical protein REPUB_Repub07fG0187800 [Reevesia pubescens]